MHGVAPRPCMRHDAAPRRRALRGAATDTAASPAAPSSRSALYNAFVLRCAVRSTTLVPSRKRVRKRTFALVKRPSLSETTMNCAPRKRVRKSVPMCCVCDRSSAASISSRMYIGAGLNCSSAMINDSAMSDLLCALCKMCWEMG
jgi:hypothetical protein